MAIAGVALPGREIRTALTLSTAYGSGNIGRTGGAIKFPFRIYSQSAYRLFYQVRLISRCNSLNYPHEVVEKPDSIILH